MTGSLLTNKRIRKEFGSIRKIIDIPDLIGMQRNSYESFLQKDVLPEEREEKGLHAVFKSVFPIKDFFIPAVEEISDMGIFFRFCNAKLPDMSLA